MSKKPVRSQSKAKAGKRHFRDKWARSAEKAASKRKLRGLDRKFARQHARARGKHRRGEGRGKHGRPVLGGRRIWWEEIW